jgi:hypothetical protein
LLAHPLSIVAFDEPGSAVEGILKFGELVFLLDEGGIGVFVPSPIATDQSP